MRHQYSRLRVAAVCAILLAGSSAFATSFVVPEDREMVRRSHAIVIGAALTSYTQVAAYGGIETVTPFSVEEVIKGDISTKTIDVHAPGGKHGEQIQIVFGSPRFKEGDRVLLFLRRTPQKTWAATDLVLGKFTFDSDSAGRKLLVRQELDIAGWNPDGTEFREKRRRADKFLSFVRAEAAGGVGRDDYFVPKEGLSLTSDAALQPQTNVASTSAGSYLFDFDEAPPNRGVRWNSFPGAVNYTVFNTAVNPARATAAVNAAFAAWNNDAASNVNLVNIGADAGPGTPGGIVGASDGRNTIRFETDLVAIGAAGGFACSTNSFSGVLGVAGVNLVSVSLHAGPTGENFYTILEGDVDMNLNVLGCNLLSNLGGLTGGVTHEVGHSLGFRHSDQNRLGGACTPSAAFECSTNAIMNSSLPNGLNGALQEYDINAVRTVYPGAACSSPSISAHPASVSIASGANTNLSVTATGSGLTYQWFIGASGNMAAPIPGALNSVVNVAPTMTTQYWVRVTNSCTSVNSNTATVTVTAGCTFAISPMSPAISAGATGGTVTVTAGAGCAWTAVSNSSFITITGGTPGSGNGTVSYTVTANTGYRSRSGTATIAGRTFTLTQAQKTRGDASANGTGDIVWRNQATGENQVWLLNGVSAPDIGTLPTLETNWRVKGSGDLDGDGKADIVLRNAVTSTNFLWLMNGKTLANSLPLPDPGSTAWDIAAVADFNGDGKSDLLWHNNSTNENIVWLMNGATILSFGSLGTTTYTIKFPGDFNGDGKADILMRNGGGLNQIWFMNGTSVLTVTDIAPITDTAWEAEGAGDFDGDNKADILWRNYGSGSNYVWRMDAGTVLAFMEIPPITDTAWDVRSVTDFDGNGTADIVWHNYGGGANFIWLMNGGALINSGPLPAMLDLNWDIYAPK